MTRGTATSCIAAMLTFGVAAFAQTTGQNPTGSSGQAGSQATSQTRPAGERAQTQQQITLVGCIQRESDYRQAHEGGRGGAMGTGVGAGNEFVLVDASMGAEKTTAAGTGAATGAPTGTTAGTAGTTGTTAGAATTPSPGMTMMSGGKAYALTGDRERELEKYVGQRVEIVGTLEGGTGAMAGTGTTGTGTTATGTATGTAAGTTATGTGTMTGTGAGQKVSDLQQVNIVSFKAVPGSCPPMK